MNYTVQEELIFRDMENLPISKVVAKHGIPRNKLKELFERLQPFFPKKLKKARRTKVESSKYKQELFDIVDAYNRKHGTDYRPLI
jgi:hypothetical protein